MSGYVPIQLRSLRFHILMAYAQGALLEFEGGQIERSYTAFSKWLSVDHDRKATQMGSITYSNGAVSSISIQLRLIS